MKKSRIRKELRAIERKVRKLKFLLVSSQFAPRPEKLNCFIQPLHHAA